MNRHHLKPVVPRVSLVAELGLPLVVDAPANAWLNRIRGAEHGKAAREARDDARDFVAGLEQRRDISVAQADRLYTAIDRQWYDRLVTLEQAALTGGQAGSARQLD
ncbi:hypothetical protein ACYZTX_29035 [Pseudomonas sp. MDT1-17]